MEENITMILGILKKRMSLRYSLDALSDISVVSESKRKELGSRLIGECYIDGMMDGQTLEMKDAKGTKTETLMIVY